MGLMKMKYKVVWSLAAMLMASNAVAQEKQGHAKSSDTKLKIVEGKMAGKEEMGDQSRIICRKVQERSVQRQLNGLPRSSKIVNQPSEHRRPAIKTNDQYWAQAFTVQALIFRSLTLRSKA